MTATPFTLAQSPLFWFQQSMTATATADIVKMALSGTELLNLSGTSYICENPSNSSCEHLQNEKLQGHRKSPSEVNIRLTQFFGPT
jgi:hypothetical protein